MNKIVAFIPNLLTLANLLCGCIALVFIFQWDLHIGAYLIILAAVFDFLDGFAARALKVNGELGKQLDSLADVVSFGVVPGMILFRLLHLSTLVNSGKTGLSLEMQQLILPWIGLLVPLFSAYRLAKFNIDTRQTDQFIGLPTPANALFIASFPLIINLDWQRPPFTTDNLLLNPWFLIAISVVMSVLLVSEIKLFALKFKDASFINNKIRYIFLILSITLLIIFNYLGIPFILILYIVLSIIHNITEKQNNSVKRP